MTSDFNFGVFTWTVIIKTFTIGTISENAKFKWFLESHSRYTFFVCKKAPWAAATTMTTTVAAVEGEGGGVKKTSLKNPVAKPFGKKKYY